MARLWGYWTRGKLDVLKSYLDAFATASTKAQERIYLDLFAGGTGNRERLTGEEMQNSAQIALSISNPPFTKLRFFELDCHAQELERSLVRDNPGRDIRIYRGDCNEKIHAALEELADHSRAPTFAFVDPNGMEAEWSTLVALADFKRNARYKVEIFLLFAVPMFMRVLPVHSGNVSLQNVAKIDALFGSRDWMHIYESRREGLIGPEETREQYLNLMRWRMENALGYEWTHPIEVRNIGGSPIYYMILATDHFAGTKIISHLYKKAAEEFPAMREEARRIRDKHRQEEKGVLSLFSVGASLEAPIEQGERFYEHQPPQQPQFLQGET